MPVLSNNAPLHKLLVLCKTSVILLLFAHKFGMQAAHKLLNMCCQPQLRQCELVLTLAYSKRRTASVKNFCKSCTDFAAASVLYSMDLT